MSDKKNVKKKVAKKAAKKKVAKKKVAILPATPLETMTKENVSLEDDCKDKIDSCSSCKFSQPLSEKSSTCRRYPSPPGVMGQSTMPKDGWCGEYKAE